MLRTPRPRPLAALLLALLPLAGCLADPTAIAADHGNQSTEPFTVTGTLANRSGAPVPASARVVVVWHVSTGKPVDYDYVFGGGTVNAADGTFRVVLESPPPTEAMNAGTVGIGTILLTTDPAIRDGAKWALDRSSSFIGGAGGHLVVYVAPDAAGFRGWITKFPRGYSMGRGVSRPGEVFDDLEPAGPTGIELIVDALRNIHFPNWT